MYWWETEPLTQAEALDWCNTWTKLKWSFTWSSGRDPAALLINPNHRRRGQIVDKLSHLTPTKRLWSKGLDALIWQLKHYCSLTRTPRSVKRKQQVASRLVPASLLHFHLFHSAAAPLCPAQRCQLGPPCRSQWALGWWRGLGLGGWFGWKTPELMNPSAQLKTCLTCETRKGEGWGVGWGGGGDVGLTTIFLSRQAPAAKSHPPWIPSMRSAFTLELPGWFWGSVCFGESRLQPLTR